MTEMKRIDDQLRRAYEGEAWHGPSIREVLAGVTAEQAGARPIPGAHTIWELVHHVIAWQEIVRRRLEEEPAREVSEAEDWPPVDEQGEAAWQAALERLDTMHRRLRVTVAGFPEARLEDPVAGADYTYYFLLHGLIQHDLYHAGQIALLKKALGPA